MKKLQLLIYNILYIYRYLPYALFSFATFDGGLKSLTRSSDLSTSLNDEILYLVHFVKYVVNPTQTRKFHFNVIPQLADQVEILRSWDGAEQKREREEGEKR